MLPDVVLVGLDVLLSIVTSVCEGRDMHIGGMLMCVVPGPLRIGRPREAHPSSVPMVRRWTLCAH